MSEFHNTRPAAVAGQFYPRNAVALQESLTQNIHEPATRPHGRVRALIVPHAGYEYSGATAGKAYALLKHVSTYRRAVVIAPSHRVPFSGLSVGNYSRFDTPLGAIPVDTETCQALVDANPLIETRAEAQETEHALEVQLPFLQHVLGDFTLVPIVCGHLAASELDSLAKTVGECLWTEDTLWIISSDFTHYGASFGYLPFRDNVPERLEELDRGAIDNILNKDAGAFREYLDRTGATICGAAPIDLLLAVLAKVKPDTDAHLISYTNSGRMTHDYSHTVSYASIAFTDNGHADPEQTADGGRDVLSELDKAQLLRLARAAIDSRLYHHDMGIPDASELSEAVRMQLCCFVTLTIDGRLRGCIGSLESTEPLFLNVIRNARNAAFHDPRFPALTRDEFLRIHIEISVLTPAEPIASPSDFEVGRHGIILEKGRASAVFLPQVAPEQGWDRETTLRHLSLKAGLDPDDWRRGATFKVFEAIVFGEQEGAG